MDDLIWSLVDLVLPVAPLLSVISALLAATIAALLLLPLSQQWLPVRLIKRHRIVASAFVLSLVGVCSFTFLASNVLLIGATDSALLGPVGQIADAYWNTWFTHDGAIVDTLETNKISTFSLDLSRYQYRLNKSVQVDAGLQKKLRETKAKQFRLFIRPILVGGALAFVNQKDSANLMTVEIDRLRVKKDDTKENALFRDFRAGAIPLADFAKQTRASDEFEFKVLAKRDGCASIALSIWDESGQFPLDHLVHTVTVGAGPAAGKSCGNDRAGVITISCV